MKKLCKYVILIFAMVVSFALESTMNIKAASIIASSSNQDIFGETISNIRIYSNGKVELEYKYGLRKVNVYYCEKGEQCDNGNYYLKSIMESDAQNPYKNTEMGLAKYEFNADIDAQKPYRLRVEAYFGTSSAYSGTESINGSFTVGAVQIADTEDEYINDGSESSNLNIKDSRISKLMEKIKNVVNTIILPIIYAVTGFILVIKGAILGVQIVKSADDPSVRREKIGALKWLIIGVAITYAAASLVGVVSGFFQNAFNL